MAVSAPSCAPDDKSAEIVSMEEMPRPDKENRTTAPHPASVPKPPREIPADLTSSSSSSSRTPSAGRSTLALVPRPSQAPIPATQPSITSPFLSAPVTLLVGGPASPSPETAPVPFYVHAGLLTGISPFFNAAFGAGASFAESASRTMTLPEDRPDDVRFLLQWVYACASGAAGAGSSKGLAHDLIDKPLAQLVKHREERRALSTAGAEENGVIDELVSPRPKCPPAFGPLLRLWLLADKFDVRAGLRGEICERVREVSRRGTCVPGREDVWALWEGCVGGARRAVGSGLDLDLKRVVLEIYVGRRTGGMFVERDGEGGTWHPGFLVDLVGVLMRELRREGL